MTKLMLLLHEFEGTGLYESRMARVFFDKEKESFVVEFYDNAVKLTECHVKSSERLAEDIAENWALGEVVLNYEEVDIIFTPEPSGSNDP